MFSNRDEAIRKECSNRVFKCHEIKFDITELCQELRVVIQKYWSVFNAINLYNLLNLLN